MTKDKGIFIKNIYYMLTYAFHVLRQNNYDEIASEEFEEIQDLFAAILAKGIAQQLKQGLYREYVTMQENLPLMRGKLNINGTINNVIQRKHLLSCEFDVLSENNIMNRILKTTAEILLKEQSVATKNKIALKKVMIYFQNVDTLHPSSIRWNMLKFQRNNRNYQMLMNVCYFVLNGLLMTTENGNYRMQTFSDEHMAKLYEKFVLEYYKQHHKELYAYASQVEWNLDSDVEESMIKFLPVMQTDIMLKSKTSSQILIIDTKYYSKTMQTHFGTHTLYSNNLYQIFTYVKNQDVKGTGNVAGMLLYAKTDEDIIPDCEFTMGGNRISVKTLDLNCEFAEIKKQLDEIVEGYFAVKSVLSGATK